MSLSLSPRFTEEKKSTFATLSSTAMTDYVSTTLTEATLTRASVEQLGAKSDQILQKLAEALRPAHFQIEERIHLRSSHPDFVGRQSFLDRLSQPLSNQPNLNPSLTVRVVSGPAGFGKTELAIQFANLNKERFSLIWLFHCESEELFEQEMRDFGKALGSSLEKVGFGDQYETLEKSYGRVGRRRYCSIDADELPNRAEWVGIRSLGMINRERTA